MSVHTSVFGGVTLTGKDASKFVKQVKNGKPKQAAKDTAARGKKMLAEYEANGFVTIRIKRR